MRHSMIARRRFCGVFFAPISLLALTALLAGCAGSPQTPDCIDETTPIAAIQGEGFRSPMIGETVTVEGVVTLITGDGFYLEQPLSDQRPETSDALFVQTDSGAVVGQRITAVGTVTELGADDNTLTALSGPVALQVCARNHPLPETFDRLPLDDTRREALEGMRLGLDQPLVISDLYRTETGRMMISADRVPLTPTEHLAPGAGVATAVTRAAAASLELRIAPIWLLGSDGSLPDLRVGDEVFPPPGILSQDERNYHLLVDAAVNFGAIRRPETPPAASGLRVVSFNLKNYFNGDGQGGGFPTPRGAESAAQFQRQRDRFRAAFSALQPDILAVQELENDGFGPRSAAADLLRDLTAALPDGDWQVITTPVQRMGDDQIAVGMFYRADRVTASGPAATLDHPALAGRSRTPLAQRFQPTDDAPPFWLVVNHLKSKGSCDEADPANTNQRDGQGCWNVSRTRAAQALSQWLDGLLPPLASSAVLMVGDFNAYRREDPMRALAAAGWIDLVAEASAEPRTTFVFRGQAGTLDYALATPTMAARVARAWVWPINAEEIPGAYYADAAYRASSDHNPVVVDLKPIGAD